MTGIYIAITPITRFMVVEMKRLDWTYIIGLSVSILILTAAIFVLRYHSDRFAQDQHED